MPVYLCLVALFAILIGLCFIDAKGIIANKILFILMFTLLAYNKSNVDMGAYLTFYENIHTIKDIFVTDPAFGLIMYTGKLLGLDYYGFLAYLAVLGLIALAIIFRHYSKLPAIVLALYFIFDYSAEIIQIRAFLAEMVMYVLMMDVIEEKQIRIKRFLITLAIGVLLHSTSIYFILILLPYIIKNRRRLTVIVFSCCFLVPVAATILQYIPIPILRDKLQYYVMSQRGSVSMGALVYVLLFLMLTLFINHKARKEYDFLWHDKLNRLMDIHIITMIACVLMLYFTSNFYRILRTVMVVDFIAIGNYYLETGKMKHRTYAIMGAGASMFFIVNELMFKGYYDIMLNNSLFEKIIHLSL